jgi:hypothetical protein
MTPQNRPLDSLKTPNFKPLESAFKDIPQPPTVPDLDGHSIVLPGELESWPLRCYGFRDSPPRCVPSIEKSRLKRRLDGIVTLRK